jgi:hypothetical protein
LRPLVAADRVPESNAAAIMPGPNTAPSTAASLGPLRAERVAAQAFPLGAPMRPTAVASMPSACLRIAEARPAAELIRGRTVPAAADVVRDAGGEPSPEPSPVVPSASKGGVRESPVRATELPPETEPTVPRLPGAPDVASVTDGDGTPAGTGPEPLDRGIVPEVGPEADKGVDAPGAEGWVAVARDVPAGVDDADGPVDADPPDEAEEVDAGAIAAIEPDEADVGMPCPDLVVAALDGLGTADPADVGATVAADLEVPRDAVDAVAAVAVPAPGPAIERITTGPRLAGDADQRTDATDPPPVVPVPVGAAPPTPADGAADGSPLGCTDSGIEDRPEVCADATRGGAGVLRTTPPPALTTPVLRPAARDTGARPGGRAGAPTIERGRIASAPRIRRNGDPGPGRLSSPSGIPTPATNDRLTSHEGARAAMPGRFVLRPSAPAGDGTPAVSYSVDPTGDGALRWTPASRVAAAFPPPRIPAPRLAAVATSRRIAPAARRGASLPEASGEAAEPTVPAAVAPAEAVAVAGPDEGPILEAGGVSRRTPSPGVPCGSADTEALGVSDGVIAAS